MKDYVLKLAQQKIDEAIDNLVRARAKFRGHTPEQMARLYGESDLTQSEIIAGYEESKAKAEAAVIWIKSQEDN